VSKRASRVAEQLAAARTRLVVARPFLGALLLHLPAEERGGWGCVATDGRKLYYDPAFIQTLTLAQTQFVLGHQVLHCALGHFARRGDRVRERWDIACDYAVNGLLVEEGFEAPPGALLDRGFRGLAAEEIYPLLGGHPPRTHFDRHLFDTQANEVSAGRDDRGLLESARPSPRSSRAARAVPAPVGAASRAPQGTLQAVATEELANRWRMRVARTAQGARAAGAFGTAWERLFCTAVAPRLPWRTLLARFIAAQAELDYTFLRPSRRESEALLPRLRSDSIELHAAVDTSGSIEASELGNFLAEVDALKGQVQARVTLHLCDCALAPGGPWIYEPWEQLALPEAAAGGGGTDFRPVFAWLDERARQPDILLYFTDALGEFPPDPPMYPVAWLVKGAAPVPWGERIQLND
jgi:predicted metal-dependent peptidase